MPTYAYACTQCSHQFDAVQSFTEDSLTVCPECDGTLRKQFGAVGVVFKGGGFYKTDSRSDAGSKGSGSNGSNGAGSDGAGTKGTESKGSESKGTNGSSDSSSSTSSSSTGSSASTASSTAS